MLLHTYVQAKPVRVCWTLSGLIITVQRRRSPRGLGLEAALIGEIERAIINSNIGLTPSNNGEVIRLNMPPLTEERRRDLAKQCKQEAETAKMAVRNARREAIEEFKKLVKKGLPEDTEKDAEEQMQKTHDKFVKKIDELYALKEKEIMTV